MSGPDNFLPKDIPIPLRAATVADGLVLVSGQVGHIDYVLVEGGFEEQFRQALENLRGVLSEQGAAMRDVLKVTVLLADIEDFDVMNRIYLEYFDTDRLPARTAFAVAALPFGALVELDAHASLPAGAWRPRPGVHR